ncbi:MAG TPA: hypothetical protein VLW53_07445 [Candidatus Eisenbacteria bacterium]|nr:hypothetical protein [Candidatus Eisenbacteria bacterium]
MSRGRTYTLRNAASIVFALTAVIPLLLFTYTLYALNQLKLTEAQMGLGVALACALVGLFIFSNLMARLSEVLRYLEEQQDGTARPGTAASAPSTAGVGPEAAARPVATAAGGGPTAPVLPGGLMVPGLGTITAASRAASAARQAAGVFDEVQKTMWQAEAQRHLGRRVLISVKNATEPIEGSLAQIAEDGVLLEQGDERVAVSYLRITNIEVDPTES